MKKTLSLFALVLIFPLVSLAQTVKPKLSPDCIKYMSYYQQDYKEKKYDIALDSWRKAFQSCPENASQNMYVHGTTMMSKLYDKTKDAAYRQAIVDTILMLQDIRVRNFPQKRTEILNNKGLYMVKYRGKDHRFIYDNLPPLIRELGPDASNSLPVSLFKSTVSLFKDGSVGGDGVLEAYDLASDVLGAKRPKTDEEKADLASAQTVIGSLFADTGLADCNSIVEIFTPRFEADPNNVSLSSTIIRLMNTTEDCAGTDLYMKAVTTVHRQSPSHRSAYALFRMNAARGNAADAGDYLQQAIDAEDSDPETDARYWYEMGVFAYKSGMRGKAMEAARKAAELDYGFAGKAYLLMGNLWVSAPCNGELETYARYWVAADYYQKAKELDPAVEDDARAGLSKAAKNYPEPSEIFMFDLSAGQAYTASCGGMTARTTVRVKSR